ncbi:phage tail protein [Vibrio gazogenes]|uniref:Phage tail protein n=2 Tax=Vibrio gazogenes TaxID=687 RepID=A0A1Z2SKC1_VIBGA|nr:phage tail protein [Vibrio gazogenes]ASA57585.1 phage tail protein [Vibrio gazogenes]
MKDNNAPQMEEIVIPWWEDGETTSEVLKEPYFLTRGVKAFLNKIRSGLLFPLQQIDALTCHESLLNLLAWDRDIQRFAGEPLSLFRSRVKYAAINAKDAGSVAGFKRIFARLGVGIVDFKERQDPTEWDVCLIQLSDSDISMNTRLVQTLIRQYGRTCRRYRFQIVYPSTVTLAANGFHQTFALYSASL